MFSGSPHFQCNAGKPYAVPPPLKKLVYTHTTEMPKLEPLKPGARLGMGNFDPLRLSESPLKEIFDWVLAPRN